MSLMAELPSIRIAQSYLESIKSTVKPSRAAGEILANGEAYSMIDGHPWNMTVADDEGKTVMTLRFKMEVYT